MDALIGVVIVLAIVAIILYLINMLPLAPRNRHILRVTSVVVGVLTIMRQLGLL
jgi:hypothetical protein